MGPAANNSVSGVSEHKRRELADFLRTRREKLKPEQVGIAHIARRRTPGLRREEVAELAGVGTTWYTWLEQARDIQPSADVLRRLADALRLSPTETRHLFMLAGKVLAEEFDLVAEKPSATLLRLVNSSIQVPALLLGARWDVLAINSHADAAFPELMRGARAQSNWVRFVFSLDIPKDKFESWEPHAKRLLAEFRASVSDSLDHPWVVELIQSIKDISPEFSKWWREHDVREDSTALIEMFDSQRGKFHRYERTLLKPSENPRLKLLLFSPID
jgi:transcriptional regulator with XRE-family HTH domain